MLVREGLIDERKVIRRLLLLPNAACSNPSTQAHQTCIVSVLHACGVCCGSIWLYNCIVRSRSIGSIRARYWYSV